jgi:hypothetical protein
VVAVDQLLYSCIAHNGSAVHLKPGRSPLVRIARDMFDFELPLLTEPQVQALCLSIVTSDQEAQLEQDGELDFDYVVDGNYRFSVSIFKTVAGICATFMKVPPPRVAAGTSTGGGGDDNCGFRDSDGGTGVPARVRPKPPILVGSGARPIPPDDALPPYFDS